MKIFLQIVFFLIISITQAQAGLFEYYTNTGNSNIQSRLDPDTLETLTPSYSYDLNKTGGYINTKSPYYYSDYSIRNKNYTQTNTFANNYYKSNTINFNTDYKRLKDEKNFLRKKEAQINVQLINISKMKGNYYRDYEYSLEQEKSYIVSRQKQLQQIIDDIERQENYSNNNVNTYYYSTSGQRIYSAKQTTLYNSNPRICYSYSQYPDYRFNDSEYTQNCYGTHTMNYTSTPTWVNPNLPEVKEGRIYIK